jgi:glycosyltransferase involved in cell wall biosynthesis
MKEFLRTQSWMVWKGCFVSDPKPHVLYVFLTDEFGEDEQLSIDDIRELHQSGNPWKAICLEHSKIADQLTEFSNNEVILLPKRPSENFDLGLRQILNESIRSGVNLIHVFGSNYLGSILPWLIRYPSVAVIVSEGPRVKKTIWHLLQSFFYSRIDSIIVPSIVLKKRIQMMRPTLLSKIRVIHPGLDFNTFNLDHYNPSVLREKWAISESDYLVGMIASSEYVKSQSTFIKAAASFLRNEELARRTKFVIVGYEEDGSDELKSLIHQFHLQDQIILVPFEESLPKVLATLDVYILPSSKAMFGLQAIESLAMGTPIICASGLDSIEWIGNSSAGLLMRSGDSFDLQRKLRSILENPTELREMRKRAVKYARENYDRQTRSLKLLQLYDRMVRKREFKAPAV